MLENLVISVWSQTSQVRLLRVALLENLVISVWSQTHNQHANHKIRLENLVISVWSQTLACCSVLYVCLRTL